jgi:hypothetical protein
MSSKKSKDSLSENKNDLIDLSEDIEYNLSNNTSNDKNDIIFVDNTNIDNDVNSNSDTKDNEINVKEITLIQKDNITTDDKKVMNFINFCIKENIFDNTYYDYNNAFSVIATKLPISFEKLSNDGENIKKDMFIKVFKKDYKYRGNLKYIFKQMENENKGIISWEEYTEFFLPFIKYVTV